MCTDLYYYLRTFFEIFRITLTANGNLYKWPNKYTFIPSFFHKKYFTQFLICLSPTLRNCQLEADVRRLPVIVILNLSIIGWLLHTARVLISHKLRCCCPLPQWVVGAPPTASTGFKLLPLFSFSLLRQLTKRQTTRLAGGYRPASARWKLACEQALWERKACAFLASSQCFPIPETRAPSWGHVYSLSSATTVCQSRIIFSGRNMRRKELPSGRRNWRRAEVLEQIQR